MITSKQRAYLRSLANSEPTIMQIGKGGIGENLIKTVSDALEARELAGENVHGVEYSVSQKDEIEIEKMVVNGRKIILYRESEKNKRIEL